MTIGGFRIGLAVVLWVLCFQPVTAQITIEPRDRLTRNATPEAISRGKTASAAAAAKAFTNWLQDYALSSEVNRSLRNLDQRISETLNRTGQPGVLLHAEVGMIKGEVDRYFLVNSEVQFVGAGSRAGEVYILANQKDRIKPGLPSGASVDPERSFFLWVTRSNKEFVVATVPATAIFSEERRFRSDKLLLSKLNETAKQAAIGNMIAKLEKDMKDQKSRDQVAALRARADESIKRLEKIESDLAKELEKVRKAQSTYANLRLVAGVLTVAQMVGNVYASLGKDAPAGLSDAKTPGDIETMVNDVEKSAIERRDLLNVQYQKIVNEQSGIQIEQRNIIRAAHIPTADVPALP